MQRGRQALPSSLGYLPVWALLLGALLVPPASAGGPGPSIVSVSGHQLIVRSRQLDGVLGPPLPYVIAGVVWSPASTNTTTSTTDPNNANKRRPEFGIWSAIDVPLLAGMNVRTVRLMIDPGFDVTLGPIGRQVLDQLYEHGIMVIMTVDDAVNDLGRVSAAVNYYKDHPAILMWLLGNEWNINRYYGVASSIENAAQRTETAAALIKSIDENHPVATSYGDIDIDGDGLRLADTSHYVNNVAPSVDIWGLNIYRGESFGTLFTQWALISTKPMFLAEFGTDAFFLSCARTNPPAGTVADGEQGAWDLLLWNEIIDHLSASDPTAVALGGTAFEFNDEWWKVQPSGSQQRSGFLLVGGHADDFANEEFFGIVDIDRQPRGSYHVLRRAFAAGTTPGPSLSPPRRRFDFFTLPDTVRTNLPAFVVAGRVVKGSQVFVNDVTIAVDSAGGFVSRFPLSSSDYLGAGLNPITLRVVLPDGSSATTTKVVDYDAGLSTSETRLLYVDSVSSLLPGTVVIDLDASTVLGLLDQRHVRGISADGTAVYLESRDLIDTASHGLVDPPDSPLPFSATVPSNGFVSAPPGDYLYSRTEIVDAPANVLLASQLPVSLVTGSSFLNAPIPGGPAITPLGDFVYRTITTNSITKIDRQSLTATTTDVPSEGAFVSDLSVSPDGTILGRSTYGGNGRFACFYDSGTLSRIGSAQVSSDFTGELTFSPSGECAVLGASGNPAFRGGGLTTIEIPGFVQRSCSLVDLADNLVISAANEVHATSGTRSGIDVFDLFPCDSLRRSRTFYLGINQFVVSSGIPRNDDIRRVVLRDLPTLLVATAGPGGGSIDSSPPGIACGSDCVEGYAAGTLVTLSASPEAGSVVTAWTGDPDCTDGVVTLGSATRCVAVFARQTLALTILKQGSGSGLVTSAPPGIECGTDCTEAYFYGTQVSLTATPDPGSVFAGWSGPADCSDGRVTMVANTACIADLRGTALFADGFESGTTSAWSATWP